MCGRVSSTLRAADVERATGVRARLVRDDDYAADRDAAADAFDAHSACPGARLFTMVRRRCDGDGATDDDDATWRDAMAIQRMTWGIYRGARPRDESMRARATYERAYNARGETLKELALFRSARRCATLANGFFEWRDESIGGGKTIKQPYYVKRADGEPLVIASVYVDEIASGSGSGKRACETSMCTTCTTSTAHQWHDRMPVLLTSDEDIKRWCLTSDGDDEWERCIKPCEDGYLVWHPVTTKVNRADYRASDAVKPTKRAAEQNVGSIAALFAAAAPPAKKTKALDDIDRLIHTYIDR